MSSNSSVSKIVVFLLLFPAISGCVEEEPKEPLEISFSLDSLEGGVFQSLRLTSSSRMSVMVPYLVINPDTGYVQNGTVLDFNAGYDTHGIQILGPPGAVECIFLMAEYGRDDWPVRKTNESWREWIARDGHLQGFDGNIGARSESNSTYPSLYRSNITASAVEYAFLDVLRPFREGYTIDEGSMHGTGIIDGLTVFEMMEVIAVDGDFNDLWGPFTEPPLPAYTNALNYFSGKLASYGYDAQIHNYRTSSSPRAENVCGYKTGTLYPDEWLVLGAHLDVAEPGSGPGGGTSVGAHDNKAGVALVMEAARGLAQFEHRRTIVVCLWSNEENGYDGSDMWIETIPSGVTVTNYLNADAVGTNWPGDYTLVVDCIPNYDDENLGDQWEMIGLLEWIGTDNHNVSEALRLGREIFNTEGYASMKDVDSSDQKRQSISVHDSDRGRSDYERFADQLGVVSVDWGSLTGGSDCYHAECDTLETMIDMMVIDNGTGQQSLVLSFDLISWWIFVAAMHLDETPIYDKN
ncbi:MAG: M20/M25/M40 family metallo-hydrolase [Candidatus Thermoplasmatota archaeon]|nr:M20/M25/M40 family metallo-hydrolase [Candidatus Thermoplasmatota archaeon]